MGYPHHHMQSLEPKFPPTEDYLSAHHHHYHHHYNNNGINSNGSGNNNNNSNSNSNQNNSLQLPPASSSTLDYYNGAVPNNAGTTSNPGYGYGQISGHFYHHPYLASSTNSGNGPPSIANSNGHNSSVSSNPIAEGYNNGSEAPSSASVNPMLNPYSATAAVTSSYGGYYGGTAHHHNHHHNVMDLPIQCPNTEPTNTALGLQELGIKLF